MKPGARVRVGPLAMPSLLPPLIRRAAGALCALFVATNLPAQPGGPRAYFYTEPDFRGEVFVVEAGNTVKNLADLRDSRGRAFNDRICSVQLEGPVRVTVFQHADFRGATLWLARDVRDLDRLPLDPRQGDTWARFISSVQVEAGAPPASRWERREAERIVRAEYLDCFGREPDENGRRYYLSRLLEAGWSDQQLRDALRRSQEFRDRDLDAIVRRVYLEVLGREPDSSGFNSYRRALGRGMTEGEMRADLLRSREGRDAGARLAVARAYREVLKREPDDGGMANYTRLMQQKGWSESDVREDLRRSAEYKQLRGR